MLSDYIKFVPRSRKEFPLQKVICKNGNCDELHYLIKSRVFDVLANEAAKLIPVCKLQTSMSRH